MTAAREAISERLVTDLGDRRYSFSHALVRDTLYDEVSPAQRAAVHERIGLALEEICGDEPEARLGELANHFLSAAPRGDIGRAIDYAERAGAQAMDQLAYEEAAELYERALEVLELSDEPDEARRCGLLLALGGAQMSAGNFADSRQAYDRAADSARALGDTDRLVGAAIGIALLSEAGVVDEALVELLDQALEAVGARAQRRARELAQRQGAGALLGGRPGPLRAADGGGARDRPPGRGPAGPRRRPPAADTSSRSSRTRSEERLAIADEMLKLGEACEDREMVVRSHAYRLREYLELGDIPAVDRELSTYARLAEELRMPQHIWQTFALRAMRAMIDGELEEAEELAGEARRRGERAEQPLATQYYGVQLVLLRRFQGRSDELLPAVRELAEQLPGDPGLAHGPDQPRGARRPSRGGPAGARAVRRRRLLGDLPGRQLAAGDGADRRGDRAARRHRSRRVALRAAASLRRPGDRRRPRRRRPGARRPGPRIAGALARSPRRRPAPPRGRHGDGDQDGRPAVPGRRPGAAGRGAAGAGSGTPIASEALELLSEALSSARQIGARGIADQALELRLEAQGLAGVDVTTSIDDVVSALESEQPDLRAHAAPDGTVAILFSDIEDSTVLTERLGDERWLEVLREHNPVFREQVGAPRRLRGEEPGRRLHARLPRSRARRSSARSAVQRAFAERELEHECARRSGCGWACTPAR